MQAKLRISREINGEVDESMRYRLQNNCLRDGDTGLKFLTVEPSRLTLGYGTLFVILKRTIILERNSF